MNKALFDSVFKRIECGALAVHYWDGEEINYGDQTPVFRLVFNKPPSLLSMIDDPILTICELYMDGDISFEGSVDAMICLMNDNPGIYHIKQNILEKLSYSALAGLKTVKDKIRQKDNIHSHYDLGNDFYALWLDETMCYSCGYFEKPDDSLHQAQLNKIDLILRKLRLKPGMRLLDIGCGWGWFILRAAQQYGVKALGITLSEEQLAGAQKRINDAGLSDLVEVRLVNYLDLDSEKEQFDRISSVGMFEHVGRNYLAQYMQKVYDLLTPGGVSMLHTLTSLKEYATNTWIERYIFPGGYIPSLRETVNLLPDFDFHMLHIESLRRHYARTLDIWYETFTQKLDAVRNMFDERFIRMWGLYLQSAAASLRTGNLDVHQILFTKGANNELPITLSDIYCHHY